jgi:hypothetical protein
VTIGEVIGRTLTIQELSREEARQAWSATMPVAVADMLMDAWAAAIGQPAYVTDTVQEVTGTPARTFADWTKDNAAAFLSSAG